MADRVHIGMGATDDDIDIPLAISGAPIRNAGPEPVVIFQREASRATAIRPANTPSPPIRGTASR
jgi:hypothetical protein